MVQIKKIKSYPAYSKILPKQLNGVMSPLWNENDESGIIPKMVYVTTVLAGTTKGPYCHTKRRGCLFLISGKIIFLYKFPGEIQFHEEEVDSNENLMMIEVPKNLEYAIIGLGTQDALLVNICDYPFIAGDNETIIPDFGGYNFSKWTKKQ